MIKIIKELFGELETAGRLWMYVGLGTLVAAAAMSFDFGRQVSIKHAVFLGLLTIITAFAPESAYRMWTKGKHAVAIGIMVFTAPFLLIEFYSHAGYTAGLRGMNVSDSKVQNVKYQSAQDATAEDSANLKMWQTQLTELQALAPWAATVSATGLRGELEAAKKAVELEAKRGGCGPRCQKLMVAQADIEKRISQAERVQDLSKRIEATQRILDKKRVVATTTEYKSSAVAEQNAFLSKTVALVYNGTLETTPVLDASADQSVSIAMAFAGTALPAFTFFMAGLYRLPAAPQLPSRRNTARREEEDNANTVAADDEVPANATLKHVEENVRIMAPVEIEVPVSIQQNGTVVDSFRRIAKVRDTAFARRVEQVTRSYRAA